MSAVAPEAALLPAGALVVLSPPGRLVPLTGHGEPAAEAADFNGSQAQLLEWREGEGWLVVTLGGQHVVVPGEHVRLITADELEDLGIDLVLGPASKLTELTKYLASLLRDKGFAAAGVLLPQAQRAEACEAAQILAEDGLFGRLPASFEAGYLGRGARAKVALLDSAAGELPPELLGAALPTQDRMLSELSELLSPHLQEAMGFTIVSRTNSMLRLPLSGEEGEAPLDEEEPPEPSPKEADDFLALMGRRRLCAVLCLGPGAARLRLQPRAQELTESILLLNPGTLLLFLTDFYDFEYEPDGHSLALQSFFLEAPVEFALRAPRGALQLTPEDLPPPTGPGLPAGEPVCVSGMASRDPCYVDDHEKLWTALRHGGCDGFLEIPYSRFDVDQYIHYEDQAVAVQTGRSYCRHQGHIEGVEVFDSAFFNIPQAEAYGMDPEQRIVLETGWLAMSEAGFDRKEVQKQSAHLGVFVGISSSDWRDVCQTPSANGVPETFIANRFSYLVNLKGPSFISNTACSASLVAMHSAKVHMLFPSDPLDGALVVGVSLNLSPGAWIGNCAGNMLSFVGRSFSFNNTADGYGRGEGCAASVIKRAEYDPTDPTTYALLAGSNTNSDGRSASLTAPNGPAQQRLLRAILSETELEPSEVCVYEAHGTGTSLGDPIEIGAVRKVLTQRAYPVMISCSKTSLGHLEGGAGMSSFCKCVMACMHTECAPNQHLNLLNPHMDIEGWPSLIPTEGHTMRGDTTYVGVSGFGYGGTNSHSMTYGRNVVTSRGGANPRYLERALFRKVRAAPPPQISMAGDSYEEWVSTGPPHLSRNLSSDYTVEVLEGGELVWREVPRASAAGCEDFQIQGSFTAWEPRGLEASASEPGLFWFDFELGASGEETFQIVADFDPDLVLYPELPRCTRRAAKLLGPGAAPSREHAWLVKGAPGSRHRVEFFCSSAAASVSWHRCAEEIVEEALAAFDYIQE